MIMKKTYLLCLGLILSSLVVHAQEKDSLSELLNLSVEELINTSIYSASKAQELTFEAPLSSTVLTRSQIKKAGCTSIPDALRLVPGVIVREQTNGNYDIHLRGLDNVPPNSSLIYFTSSTTLVMIDNRPVYNYLHGGTFWETLPIDLNDVERIEVIRGPSAAMYGPNAVSGVINIITRKPEKEGLYTVANAQYGNYNTQIGNTSIGYKFNEKIDVVISGNYQNRNRTQTKYYDIPKNEYFDSPEQVTVVQNNPEKNFSERYPHPHLAMRKHGINGFLNYKPREKVLFTASLGTQNSEVQKEFGADTYAANITTATSETKYADLKGSINDLNLQFSYLSGTQSPVKGANIWTWDFNTLDAVVEYNFTKIKNLSIKPGLNYRRAIYDDSKYVNVALREGFWSGKAESETQAVSLRTDYKLLNDKLRLIGCGRIDKFNLPDKSYFSYQLAATYKLNEKNILRAVQSRSNRAPLIIDLFSNLDLILPFGGPDQIAIVEVRGNQNIKLLTSDMYELGYRSRLRDNLEIDIEVFTTKTKDFSDIVFESGAFGVSPTVSFQGLIDFTNLTVYTRQNGGTMSMNYVSGKWQIKPFITVQETMLYDYSIYANSPNAPALPTNNNDPAVYNLNFGKGSKIKHLGTPSVYGGAYINYKLSSKININLNPYFFSDHTQLHSSNLTYKDGARGVEKIKSKIIMNAAVSYAVTKRLNAFVNARNFLNDRSREFYTADKTAIMVSGGVNFEF